MSTTELETILRENLQGLCRDQEKQRLAIQSLEAQQTELEKQLTRLSELYRHLLPLIDNINESLTGRQ